VGCGLDQAPLNFTALPTPPDISGSYQWSVMPTVAGSGVFSAPTSQSTEFRGTAEGDATVKVVLTYQGQTAQDTELIHVVRIDNLPDCAVQVMEQPDLPTYYPYVIPYSGSYGVLRAVRIAPFEVPDDPFIWNTDYMGYVDHQTGDVTLTFNRAGPYVLEITREGGGGFTKQYVQALVGGTVLSPAKAGIPVGIMRVADPSPVDAWLIVISGANPPADSTGFDVVSRANLPAGWWPPIGPAVAHVDDVSEGCDAVGWAFIGFDEVYPLCVIGHGTSGAIEMGGGVTMPAGGALLGGELAAAGANWTKAFGNTCNGRVGACYLFGCSVGANPWGPGFLQALATRGNMSVAAWDMPVATLPYDQGNIRNYFGRTRGSTLVVRDP